MAELLAANQITIAKVLDGEQGIPGEPGADGKTSYFHIKYSAVANPTSSSEMSETPLAYIGTYVDFTEADSTDPTKYTWSRFEGIQGEKGEQGIPGIGQDGRTSYLHIAYATSADGSEGFSISESANKTYIGQYTDFVSTDSTDYTKYAWTKIKGEMSAEQIAQLNQASEDAAQAKDSVDTLSDKTRSGFIETLSGTGFVQSNKTEDGGAAEVVVYGKSVQDGTPWIGTEVDSVPYLNRAMPSQSNDYNRESLKIVGGTVAWNQMGKELNATNWIAESGVTISFEDDVMVVSSTTVNNGAASVTYHTFKNGNKYLVTSKVKTETDLDDVIVGTLSSTGVSKPKSVQAGQWVDNSYIAQSVVDGAKRLYCYARNTQYSNLRVKDVMVFDLTQMFGSTIADYIYSLEQANAGAGVAWFKKLFPKDYYAHNAGELLSVEGLQSHDAVGFNQWDEEWESGYYDPADGAAVAGALWQRNVNPMPCLPNTTYYAKQDGGDFGYILFYDADGDYISYANPYESPYGITTVGVVFTTPSNAYQIKFYRQSSSAGRTLNINLSNPSRNGEYEPYEKHSYPLDSSLALRGIPKLDANNNLYYDGDEYTSDGKVKRKYGIVDLGTIDWEQVGYNNKMSWVPVSWRTNVKPVEGNDIKANILCSKYKVDIAGNVEEQVNDKTISVNVRSWVHIYDSAYVSVTPQEFKAAMSGVMLVYELATPTTETAQAYTSLQVVDPDGIEEFVSTGILPVGHNSTYLLVCPISVCDNVSVSVKGKNLFDINKIVPNNMSVENGELHLANASGGNDNIQNGQKLGDLANLEVGETYTLSANSTYSNKVIYLNTSEKGWAFGTSTVITQEDLDSRIGWYGNGAIISNIQIELGSTATDYEPYQAKTATLSDIVLRSTPDGTRDRLFKDTDGLWKVERNCAYISSYNGESITTSYYSNTGELSTGASVVYALEVPTYEILPDSIQAELNALTTYNPITNVMVSDGVTPDIDVSFWTRDYYAKISAENAAKVATNFLGYDSTNGLIVGNKTSGSWSGYRSQILPGSFNILDASSTVLASFGTTTVIGEEAKANMHLTFNNLSMVDANGTEFFKVGDNRNADGIATLKSIVTTYIDSTGSVTLTFESSISSVISVYVNSVELSSSNYSVSGKSITFNNLTPNSRPTIETTFTTTEPSFYLTFGNRLSSGKTGKYSVAEGKDVIASGFASRAEGVNTEASGEYSHAGGYHTEASGDCSYAGGYWTVADGDYVTAIGKYNRKYTGINDHVFVIGNGTSDTNRSNALAVDWNGNLTLGTPLSVENGGTDATTATEARENLGIYQRELVWENANDTQKFAAQTIALDLSSYDYVEVHFFVSSTYQERVVGIGAVHGRGYRIYAQVMSNVDTSDTPIYVTQRVADVRASDVTFSDAYTKFITSTSTQQNNNRMVPTKIYAFKV